MHRLALVLPDAMDGHGVIVRRVPPQPMSQMPGVSVLSECGTERPGRPGHIGQPRRRRRVQRDHVDRVAEIGQAAGELINDDTRASVSWAERARHLEQAHRHQLPCCRGRHAKASGCSWINDLSMMTTSGFADHKTHSGEPIQRKSLIRSVRLASARGK